MVGYSFGDGHLKLNVRGVHKLLAFKSSLEIPLAAIESVEPNEPNARDIASAARTLGTYIPGLVAAGTFTQGTKRVFWDVHSAAKAIVIKLKSTQYDVLTYVPDRYDEIVVEVANPAVAVNDIKQAIRPAA